MGLGSDSKGLEEVAATMFSIAELMESVGDADGAIEMKKEVLELCRVGAGLEEKDLEGVGEDEKIKNQ